jgi:hypothetical protein
MEPCSVHLFCFLLGVVIMVLVLALRMLATFLLSPMVQSRFETQDDRYLLLLKSQKCRSTKEQSPTFPRRAPELRLRKFNVLSVLLPLSLLRLFEPPIHIGSSSRASGSRSSTSHRPCPGPFWKALGVSQRSAS